jgi:hypothetical protein
MVSMRVGTIELRIRNEWIEWFGETIRPILMKKIGGNGRIVSPAPQDPSPPNVDLDDLR